MYLLIARTSSVGSIIVVHLLVQRVIRTDTVRHCIRRETGESQGRPHHGSAAYPWLAPAALPMQVEAAHTKMCVAPPTCGHIIYIATNNWPNPLLWAGGMWRRGLPRDRRPVSKRAPRRPRSEAACTARPLRSFALLPGRRRGLARQTKGLPPPAPVPSLNPARP